MAINFDSFQEGTTSTIQSDDYVVGFDTAVPGGERKWQISTLANAVSGIMNTELNNKTTSNIYLASNVSLNGLSILNYSGALPSTCKRITILWNDVSGATTNQTSYVRMGTGGYDTTGYNGGHSYITATGGTDALPDSIGFLFTSDNSAACVSNGYMVLNKGSGNTWYSFSNSWRAGGPNTYMIWGSSNYKIFTSTVDSIQIINTVGTFDSGNVSISYEF